MRATLRDRLRASPWLLATLLCALVVAIIAPHQLGVLVWSLTKITAGAYAGYWIDRSIFHYARPDMLPPAQQPFAWLRRAVVVGAVILGLASGV